MQNFADKKATNGSGAHKYVISVSGNIHLACDCKIYADNYQHCAIMSVHIYIKAIESSALTHTQDHHLSPTCQPLHIAHYTLDSLKIIFHAIVPGNSNSGTLPSFIMIKNAGKCILHHNFTIEDGNCLIHHR